MLTTTSDHDEYDHARSYAEFEESVRVTFQERSAGGKLFTTDGPSLFLTYLDGLPLDRQTHNCSACRRFFDVYGGLVTIDETGAAKSALWDADAVPSFYRGAVAFMQQTVERRRVTGPFLSREPTWGTPQTGPWSHLAVRPPRELLFRHAVLTPGQAMAAKREDFATVARALAEFTPDMLATAMQLLQAETLARSDRFIGPVKWLQDLHAARQTKHELRRANVLWRAIATAPEGYCHPRASVVGTLLEDIAAGLPFEAVRSRFNAKMHPLQYQRPQAAPTAGAIAQAEKLVDQMGLAPALERRWATLEDVETIWKPAAKAEPEAAPGVFSHLKPKGQAKIAAGMDVPAGAVTWEKFVRTVLPTAEAMEMLLPVGRGAFIGITTAVHAEAPPLLKWDREDRRNQVAWYCYHMGSAPQDWGLVPGAWCKITAIMPLPTLWGDNPQPFLGEGAVLVLDGARDRRTGHGNALFPECIRQELHEVRSAIEAYSRTAVLSGREEASANGYDIRKGREQIDVTVRVTSGGRRTSYRIDRWD